MAEQTYVTTGSLRDPTAGEGERAELLSPGTEIDLTDEQAQPLLDRDPPAIRKPGAGEAPAPEPTPEIDPLAPETIAEIEAILPAIDDVDRLEAALEAEETKGGQEAIQARLDELAADDEE